MTPGDVVDHATDPSRRGGVVTYRGSRWTADVRWPGRPLTMELVDVLVRGVR